MGGTTALQVDAPPAVQFVPCFSRVLLQPVRLKTRKLIVLVDHYDKGAQLYKVLGAGPYAGIRDGVVQETFKEGDIVMYHQNKVITNDFKGKRFYSGRDEDCICKALNVQAGDLEDGEEG